MRTQPQRRETVTEAQEQAKAVVALIDGDHTPDFIREAMLHALDTAFAHVGLDRPTDSHGVLPYTVQDLVPLFVETKLISWPDMYSDDQRVRDAIHTLLHNPQTPAGLFEAVAEWILAHATSKGDEGNVLHSEAVIQALLESVPAEELIGAQREVKEEGGNL